VLIAVLTFCVPEDRSAAAFASNGKVTAATSSAMNVFMSMSVGRPQMRSMKA
jgi:hypothetical protein